MAVSFLLKYEPVETIQKFEFMVKDQSIWKFLGTFRVQNIAFAEEKSSYQVDLQIRQFNLRQLFR